MRFRPLRESARAQFFWCACAAAQFLRVRVRWSGSTDLLIFPSPDGLRSITINRIKRLIRRFPGNPDTPSLRPDFLLPRLLFAPLNIKAARHQFEKRFPPLKTKTERSHSFVWALFVKLIWDVVGEQHTPPPETDRS